MRVELLNSNIVSELGPSMGQILSGRLSKIILSILTAFSPRICPAHLSLQGLSNHPEYKRFPKQLAYLAVLCFLLQMPSFHYL